MIKNYLRVAWRNLWKHKLFGAINVAGLAIGLTSSMLIMLWVRDEITVDRFHENLKDLYQVKSQLTMDGDITTLTNVSYSVFTALPQRYPEIKEICTFTRPFTELVTDNSDREKAFREKGVYATPGFLSMFTYPFLQGDPRQALTSPNTMAISEALAERLYGKNWRQQNLLGRTVQIDQQRTYRISGVYRQPPRNATLQFDYVAPFNDHLKLNPSDSVPDNFNNEVYVQLQPNTSAEAFNAKIRNAFSDITGIKEFAVTLTTQPLKDTYLYGQYKNGKVVGGRIEYVRIMIIVAVFLLVIACINFMNLATARSSLRAREIGVRKASGADRRSIFTQFILESILLTTIAAVVAIIATIWLVPVFNRLTGKYISIDYTNPVNWMGMIAVILFTGLLSGSYPAVVLSGMKPVKILKGHLTPGSNTALLRKGLVVFQYVLSVILIVSTIVVKDQLHYIQHKHLGLDRNNLFYTTLEKGTYERNLLLKNMLQQDPSIEAVTFSNNLVIDNQSSTWGARWEGKDEHTQLMIDHISVGYDFVKTMKMAMAAGREFSPSYGMDTLNFMVNEAAVKAMGLKNPVGAGMEWIGRKGKIIGVVKDFHLRSMHKPIGPMLMYLSPDANFHLYVRPRPGQTKAALAATERAFKALSPGYPFRYFFMDESFARLYEAESRLGSLANWFAGIAVVISCLGLFGLASFTIQQRTREIGVRKVLGASVRNIVALLSKDFISLVLIALLVACPVAWYVMHNWLQHFAYRTGIQWWVFAGTAFMVVVIALLTVSFQSIKAALANPVKSLRTE